MSRSTSVEQPLVHSPPSYNSLDATLADIDTPNKIADMAPTQKDQYAMYAILAGSALLVGGTFLLILTSNPTTLGLFAPHAPLNSLALVVVALGIAAVQPPTPAAAVREKRLDTHKNVAGTGVALLLAGTTFMYYNKEAHGAEHRTTRHANAGSIVVAWIITQSVIGSLAVQLGQKGLWIYKWHRRSGYILTTVALSTAFAGGMYSTWAVSRGPSYVPLRVASYGVGIPLIALGLFLRIQSTKLGFAPKRTARPA